MEAWARQHTRFIIEPVVGALARLGVTPNTLTVAGFAFNVLAGVLIGLNLLLPGGLVMALVAMPLDALDGSLARATGKQTRFGAFFDSVLDRFAEAAVLVGLAAYFMRQGDGLSVLVAFVAMVGSFMVSYTRARAEGLGLECKVGVFSRLGRVILMAAGLILNLPVIMIWLLAVLSLATAVQRIVHVYRTASSTSTAS